MSDTSVVQFISKLREYRDLDSSIASVWSCLEEEVYAYLDKDEDRDHVSLMIKSTDDRLKDIRNKTLILILKKEFKECIDVGDIREIDNGLEIDLSIDIDTLYRLRDKKKDRAIAFRLVIDENKNDEICLMGWPLQPGNKYPIFKSNNAKNLKDIFCGLINHTQPLFESTQGRTDLNGFNPLLFSAYKFDEFMDQSRGKWHDLSESQKQKVMEINLPKEISEQCNPLFKKLYRFFIKRSDRGDQILFKPVMSNKEFEDLHTETKESGNELELLKAFMDASTLCHK